MRLSLLIALPLASFSLFAQSTGGPAFDVASVKPSGRIVGKDANMQLAIGAAGMNGRNLTLKQLILEAYDLWPHQIAGGPKWLDDDEYDLDAKAAGPASKEQLRLMLRALLAERFGLAMHSETKEMGVYELVVDKNGPKIHPVDDSVARGTPGSDRFHGDLHQFANLLSLKLRMPAINDPTRPVMAGGGPIPVIDNTGLSGTFDFPYEVKLELGVDMFVSWQRVLQDQLGLKLERKKSPVEVYTVDRASRVPAAN